jgi:hypothetical protein
MCWAGTLLIVSEAKVSHRFRRLWRKRTVSEQAIAPTSGEAAASPSRYQNYPMSYLISTGL